jgi:HPt (histidine-containing phosphotransfer) domain-containing protein
LAAAAVLDIKNAISVLEEIHAEGYGGPKNELFVTTVHGMKSALANIGEAELSSVAWNLETAGEKGDLILLAAKTPAFIKKLQALLQKLKRPKAEGETESGDMGFLKDKLEEIKAACAAFDMDAAKAVLDDLNLKSWRCDTADILDEISVSLLRGEVKKVVAAAERGLKKTS